MKGVQVSAVGRLPHGMDLIAGYAYLSSAVLYSPFYPASVGYPLANVPKQTFNAFHHACAADALYGRAGRELCR